MPYLLCESSHEVGWVLWSIFILPWSRAGLCFSLYLERECVRIYQRRRARSTLKNGFAWLRPNRTSWSGFFVPGTIFGSIRFIWAKTQPSRPFHSKDTCPFGPYVLPFPILFYIKDHRYIQSVGNFWRPNCNLLCRHFLKNFSHSLTFSNKNGLHSAH